MAADSRTSLPGLEATPGGARYAVIDQGAHVLEWQPPGERPVLWTSRLSRFSPGVAIRGGVPVVFPWFGSGTDGTRSPAHGYARVTAWHRESATEDAGVLTVRYSLPAPDPDALSAELEARFGPDSLTVALVVTNDTGRESGFEAALHTYLAVGDIRTASIAGLAGNRYRDTVPGAAPGPHLQAGPVQFVAETDRLYAHDGEVVLRDPAWDRSITVSKSGSASTVVWNPWVAKAAALSDFGDEEWTSMVCIEAGNLREASVRLAPGGTHTMTQTLRLS